MPEGNKFSPEKKSDPESVMDIKRRLAMYYRDLADHEEGLNTLSAQDLINTEREIKVIKSQLHKLEK